MACPHQRNRWANARRSPKQDSRTRREKLLGSESGAGSRRWTVQFDPKWGGPDKPVAFTGLTDWSKHADPRIHYYSGTADYRTTFQSEIPNPKSEIFLDLGAVEVMVRVRLNGQDCGIAWKPPYRVDISNAARAGKNELEIEVTNLWVNRLIGDAGLPKSKRYTGTNASDREPDKKYRQPLLRGYLPTDPLLRSGLLGPVSVEFGERRDLAF